MKLFALVFAFVTCTSLADEATEQLVDHTLDALLDTHEIPVTIDNFNRAATDIEFEKYVALAGGVNRFYHFREPTPVDNQPTVSMNRDTLYSAAIIDISEGATLVMPEVGAIQDRVTIEAASARPFKLPNYDTQAYTRLVQAIIALAPFVPDSTCAFGARDHVLPVRHLIGTAVGWGGLPENEALYLGIDPGLPVGEYQIHVPAEVPVGAFWSISLYNAQRFFEPNDLNAYTVNSVMGQRNEDGSMTVHFGGCTDGRINCLPVMEGWNYTVRMYQPGPEILDGSWTFPAVEPAEKRG